MNIDLLVGIGVIAVFVAVFMVVALFCCLRAPADDYVGPGCNAPWAIRHRPVSSGRRFSTRCTAVSS